MKRKVIYAVISLVGLLTVAIFSQAGGLKNTPRFQMLPGEIILDSQTGLMWANGDNGKDATYYDAEKHCDLFQTGGYDDWRVPDIKELMTLYLPGKKNASGCMMSALFHTSGCSFWSSYSSIGGAAVFNFKVGKRSFSFNRDSYGLRALPVRGTLKVGTAKEK